MFDKVKENAQARKYGELNYSIDMSGYYEFTEEKTALAWGQKLYSDWGDSYLKNIKLIKRVLSNSCYIDSISCYCGYMYRQMNEYLRKEKDDERGTYREMVHTMIAEMCNAPRLDRKLIVYRLVNESVINNLINCNKNGEPMQEKGFLSTSLMKKTIVENDEFASYDYLLKIYVDENEAAIYPNVIAKRNEQEMIFLPNSYLGLVKYPYKDIDSQKFIYECELINFNN